MRHSRLERVDRNVVFAAVAAALRRYADHELSPPITGPLSGLTDVLVHGGDIRIPLGLPFARTRSASGSPLTS